MRSNVPTDREPVFYDIEASGLEGVPIEIGWAFVDHSDVVSRSFLVKPPLDWHIDGAWDDAAEALHGITRGDLIQHGLHPLKIASKMNEELAGRELFSDSAFDEPWLRQLFDAAGIETAFAIRLTGAEIYIAGEAASRGIVGTAFDALRKRAAKIAPILHRAEADARHLVVQWLLVQNVKGP